MEDLKFEIAAQPCPHFMQKCACAPVVFEHNLNVWELADTTSTCGYLRGSGMQNPMWYAPDRDGKIPEHGATLAQAQAALAEHTSWLVEVMQSPARLAEVRLLLEIAEARRDVADSEKALAARRARLDAASLNLAQLRGES